MRSFLGGALLLLVVTGCPTDPALLNRQPDNEKREAMGPVNPNRIEISGGHSSGINGGPASQYTWVLEKNGTCQGTVYSGKNNSQGETKEYELPIEVFEECRALLAETDFFRMKSARPEVILDASTTDIRVAHNGREHIVSVVSPATGSDHFYMLMRFITDLSERGKPMPPAKNR